MSPTSAPPNEIDARVEALLLRMTVEEKIGQMRQLPEHLLYRDGEPIELRQGLVGSVLNIVDPDQLRQLQKIAVEETRLGIPLLIGRDVIHGFRTMFPIPLAQAATWNPEVVETGARIAALEARSVGINWTFAPVVDVTRDPRWGRVAESPGEDPFLACVMAKAAIRGTQGDETRGPTGVAACVKHFAGYGATEGGRDYNTTWIPEQQLWEVFLPSYKAAVDAGALTIMCAFNDLNGVPCSGNAFLFSEVLRERWGFRGCVVSDWASVEQLIAHGIAGDSHTAALLAVRAGVDMEMATSTFVDNLGAAIAVGELDQAVIDERVRAILRTKFMLGLFDDPFGKKLPPQTLLSESHLAAARRAAVESIVLLQNQNRALPLSRELKSIAVIGPLADAPHDQLGTWTFDGRSEDTITPLRALRELGGEAGFAVNYAPGLEYSRMRTTGLFPAAAAAAEASDVVLLFLGEESILSGEAHCRAEINLPGAQAALVAHLAALGKPLIVVIMAGRPLTLGPVLDQADAIFYAWHPGTMGGPALADVLFGFAEPTGRLPITFPKSVGQIPIYYGHRNTGRPFDPDTFVQMDAISRDPIQDSLGNESHYLDLGHEPEFHFGFGMGYTSFAYSDLTLEQDRIRIGMTANVRLTLTNVGDRAGTEVAQLYIRDRVGSITRPVRELKGWSRIRLEPGESREVHFQLGSTELSFPDSTGALRLEPGEFDIFVGSSSAATDRVVLTLLAET